MGRRNFVTALATMGISSSAVDHLTTEELRALTDDPTDEVPRLSRLERAGSSTGSGGAGRPERTPVFYTIPRDVWEYREGRRKAANELGARLRAAGYDGVRTEVTSRVDGGHRELVVNVVRTARAYANARSEARIVEPEISLEELSGEVPETVECTVGEGEYRTTVEDIPVTVEERTEELTSGDGCFEEGHFDDYYDPIPGGVQFLRADGIYSTVCTPVYDRDEAEDRLLVTGHGVDHWDVTKHDRITQPYPSHEFGDLDEFTNVGFPDADKVIFDDSASLDERNDAAVVDLSETDRETDWRMGTDDGGYSDAPIKGTIAFDELLDNAGNSSYTVYQQGRTSGLDDGTLGAVSDDNDLGYVRLNGTRGSFGDSGAPFYRIEADCGGDDAIFLVGMQHSRESYRYRPIGNALDLVEDALNVEVNPDSGC